MGKLNPKTFVAKFFDHKPLSVKVTHNPNSIRRRFLSLYGAGPEEVFGWAGPRSLNSINWRKSLIFINKNLPLFIEGVKRERKGFEVEYTTAHELAHVFAERAGKNVGRLNEMYADLIALEYFAQTKPLDYKKILRLAKFKPTRERVWVDHNAQKIHSLFPLLAREEIIRDLLNGVVKSDGPRFDEYLLAKAKKYKLPSKVIAKMKAEEVPF